MTVSFEYASLLNLCFNQAALVAMAYTYIIFDLILPKQHALSLYQIWALWYEIDTQAEIYNTIKEGHDKARLQ